MSGDELLPCTFCGQLPDEWEASPKGWVHIQCPNRKCVSPPVMDLKKRAYAKWNTRPDSKPYKWDCFKQYQDGRPENSIIKAAVGTFVGDRIFAAARKRKEG